MAYNDMFGAADEMAPQLEQEAQYQKILRALGYDKPAVAPAMEPSKGFRTPRIPLPAGLKIPSVNVPGWLLDAVASGVAETPMPNNLKGGSNLAAGFAQGFASQRMGQNATRRAAYEEAQKRANAHNDSAQRFKEAAAMVRMRARAEAPKTENPDEWTEVTPEVRKWAKENGIAIAPGVRRIKTADAVRNMPVQQPGVTLSPEAMQAWSEFVATTGTLPAGVARSRDLTGKLLEGAVPFLKDSGSLAGNRAGYRADTASLGKLQSLLDGATAFENTALKNLAVLDKTLDSIPDTGSPLLNTPMRAINRTALGAEDMAAYEAARTIIIPEFARLLQSATLAGQLTDEARGEVKKILAGNYTIPQMRRVFDVLKQDAENRKAGYQSQIDEINARIGGRSAAPGTVVSDTAGVVSKGNENGNRLLESVKASLKPKRGK